jgi:hypothetical protein
MPDHRITDFNQDSIIDAYVQTTADAAVSGGLGLSFCHPYDLVGLRNSLSGGKRFVSTIFHSY